MTSTVTRIDYATARVRLEPVISDREALAGFDRLVKSRDVDDAFLDTIYKSGISLDYLFFGKGKPFAETGVSP